MRKFHPMKRFIAFVVLLQTLLYGTHPAVAATVSATPSGPPAKPADWVEVKERNSSTARHFNKGDENRVDLYGLPTKLKDENGKGQPTLPEVAVRPDGTFGADWTNAKVTFAADGVLPVALDLGNGRSIKMGQDLPVGGAAGSRDRGKSPRVVPPQVTQNGPHKVRYAETSTASFAYEYEVTDFGLKETIVLKSFTGESSFAIPLGLTGVEIESDEAGSFVVLDSRTRETVARIPAAFAVDAAGEPAPYVTQDLIDLGDGPMFWLNVDPLWLQAPERRFPVMIDPTIILQDTAAAASISSVFPTITNGFQLNYYSAANRGDGLLKFDLGQIPEGAYIHSATLDLALTNPRTSAPISVYEVADEWYPRVVSWSSPRGMGSTWTGGSPLKPGRASLGNLTAGSLNVTTQVREWVQHLQPNTGFLFRLEASPGNSPTVNITPVLQVNYTYDLRPPIVAMFGLTAGQTINASTIIQVTAEDPAPGTLDRVELLVDGVVVQSISRPAGSVQVSLDPRQFGPGSHSAFARAYDLAGNVASTVPVPFQIGIPPTPVGVRAQLSGDRVELSWLAVPNASTYRVYRSEEPEATLMSSTLVADRLTDASISLPLSVPTGERYSFAVTAVDANGTEGAPARTSISLPFQPGQPRISSAGYEQYRISWSPSERADATHNLYRLGRFGETSGFRQLMATGITGTEWIFRSNLLLNGSFEDGLNGYNYHGYGYVKVDPSVRKFGTSSLHVPTGRPEASACKVSARPVYAPFTVSAWSRAEGITSTSGLYGIAVSFLNGTTSRNYQTSFSEGTHDWERKQITVTEPAGQGPFTVTVCVRFDGGAGKAWFDGLQIESGTEASAYQEGITNQSPLVFQATAVSGGVESQPSPESEPFSQLHLQPVTPVATLQGGGRTLLSWPSDAMAGTTYNLYRRATTGQPTAADLVRTGIPTGPLLLSRNLSANPSFEQSFAGWSYYGTPLPQIDSTSGYSGARSVAINRSSAGTQPSVLTQSISINQYTPLPVTVTARSRALDVSEGNAGEYALVAKFYASGGQLLSTKTVDFSAGSHGWEERSVTYQPTQPIAVITIDLMFHNGRVGAVWFDAVQIEEGDQATDYGLTFSNDDYVLLRPVASVGIESPSLNWVRISGQSGPVVPHDLRVVQHGSQQHEITWTSFGGHSYTLMRRGITSAGGLYTAQAVATGLTDGQFIFGRNLVTNSSFNAHNPLGGWIRVGAGDASGSAYRFAWRSGNEPPASLSQQISLNQSLPQPLTLSADLNLPSTIGATLELQMFGASGELVGQGVALPGNTPFVTTRVSTTVQPIKPATYAVVWLRHTGSGQATFSRVQLEGGATPTSWQDGPLPYADAPLYSFWLIPYVNTQAGYASPEIFTTLKTEIPSPTGLSAVNLLSIPENLEAPTTTSRIAITWSATQFPGATYAVYRALPGQPIRADNRIVSGLTDPQWIDDQVLPGQVYHYSVGTVDLVGRESTLSPVVAIEVPSSITPPMPQGDAPGLGLDDRWSFTSLPMAGGAGYLNLATGNLVFQATDLVLPGPHLVNVVRRTYNSRASDAFSPLQSPGWVLNVAQSLSEDTASGDVVLLEGDGTRHRFEAVGDGTYHAPPSVWMRLTKGSGDQPWMIKRHDGVHYHFDTSGRLRELSEPNGNRLMIAYDSSGQLSRVTGPAGRQIEFHYEGGRVTRVQDDAGRSVRYLFDSNGRMTGHVDALHQTTLYGYDGQGRLNAVTDPAGRSVILAYDTESRLISYQWAGEVGSTRFSYENSSIGTITTITNALNQSTRFVSAPTGNLLEHRDPLMATTQLQYDEWQRLIRILTARGLVTEIAYVDAGASSRVSAVTQRAEETVTTKILEYGSFDKPTLVEDAHGIRQRFSYDPKGNLIAHTVALGTPQEATTSYTYDDRGLLLTVTDSLAAVTRYTYDSLGQLRAVTNPDGGSIHTAYDSAGNPSTLTDAYGEVIAYQYDALGRLVESSLPDGGLAKYWYDGSGLLVRHIAPGDVQSEYEYDSAGRLVKQRDAMGYETRYGYDLAGNPILTFYANGSSQRKEYDATGRVVRLFDGLNLTAEGDPIAGARFTAFAYDAAGNQIAITLPNGYQASAQYDLLNRVVQVTEPPAVTTYQYDQLGRRVAEQDGNGNWTKYGYDSNGRLTHVWDAAQFEANGTMKVGAVATTYSYDLAGRRTSVTDALNRTTSLNYDTMGRLVSETDPLGQSNLIFYDLAGRVSEKIDRNGNSTIYEYDALGRLLSFQTWNRFETVRYTYDSGGRRTSMVDQLGTTHYRYDRRGLLAEVDGPGEVIRYEYDPAGIRTAMLLREGAIRYTYDHANRVRAVTDITGALTELIYGPTGELLEVRLPGSVIEVNTYDQASNRLASRKVTGPRSSQEWIYEYDPIGNITAITSATAAGANQSERVKTDYSYDPLNRLLKVAMPNYTALYSYDAVGNRLREEINSVTTYSSKRVVDYEYNVANWLTRSKQVTTESSTVELLRLYAYDGEGNLIQVADGTGFERFTYDSRNLLIKAQRGNTTNLYEYDGDGRRVRSRELSLPQGWTSRSAHFVYDGVHLIVERDGGGALRTAYGRTPEGRVLSWYTPGLGDGAVWVDHLGSVVQTTRTSDGSTVSQYAYDAFGALKGSSQGTPNALKFTGAPMDDSGLYHLYSRFYNPQVGRFITQDTWKGDPWQPWTQHLYAYVGNNPVNYVDPTGHMPQWWQSLGAQFENTFQQATNAVKNGQLFESLTKGLRRPDFFLGDEWLVELKNTGRQYWSSQLQGLQQVAAQLDRRFVLVGNEITKFSERTIREIKEGGGQIIRMTKDGTFLTMTGEVIKDLATFLGNSVQIAPIFMLEGTWEQFQRDMHPDLST